MKLYVFFVLALIGSIRCVGQNGYYDPKDLPRDKHLFALPPNAYWYQQPWIDSVNAFPEFQPGKLELINGVIPSHQLMLNYSVFLEMFLIRQDDGELIPLDYSHDIKFVWVGDHKFLYSRSFGYLEVILDGKTSVAERTFMHAIFDVTNGIKTRLSVSDNRTGLAKTTRYYWAEKQYYVFTDARHMHRTSPAVLQKIFPGQKSKIRSFVKNHKTDFSKKEDLLEAVKFCNQEL